MIGGFKIERVHKLEKINNEISHTQQLQDKYLRIKFQTGEKSNNRDAEDHLQTTTAAILIHTELFETEPDEETDSISEHAQKLRHYDLNTNRTTLQKLFDKLPIYNKPKSVEEALKNSLKQTFENADITLAHGTVNQITKQFITKLEEENIPPTNIRIHSKP